MSDDDKFVIKTGITWLMRLLEQGIPLDEEMFEFCLMALNDRAEPLIEKAKELTALIGTDKLSSSERTDCIRLFNEESDSISAMAGNFKTLVKKCKEPMTRPLVQEIKEALKGRLKDFENITPSSFEKGKAALKTYFRLNEDETALVIAIHILENWDILDDYFDSHVNCRDVSKSKLLSTMLDLSLREFHTAMSGKVAKLELIDKIGTLTVDRMVETIFSTPHEKTAELFYKKSEKEFLPLNYYALEDGVAEHILSLLEAKGDTPAHILLYGEPGSGKSSFATTAAKILNQEAYGVSSPNDGDSNSRKKSLEACLNMTDNGQDGLVVIDEADNLLNTAFAYIFTGERQDKGWLNEFLERKGVRTIWITNDIYGIPDSIMRRFAYSVNFTKLSKDQRMNVWERVITKNRVKSMVTQNDIKRLATRYPLSAGSIDLAVKKAKDIAGRKKAIFARAVEKSLEASQQLLNGGSSLRNDDVIEREYSLDGLNLDVDMTSLTTQLDAFNNYLKNDNSDLRVNMNMLFYGPPGTGKTEMSRYLSRHLKRELIVKRTSDLLSKWVGESEQQIARAFHEAEKQQAVLVIDEADSLLFSRDKATRSWETSMVNEFLTQMEHFRGLLICTTNRLEELDSASLRRFNHKIHFDFLAGEGNLSFYDRMLCPLSSKRPTDEDLLPLRSMDNLTPGDFKIIRDRFAFYPKSKVKHAELIAGLVKESEIKEARGKRKTIGFA
ncbi:MAG: AAA family ATPase [Pseudodesulfovibrio sp.]|nr:AAA family ATPase [Pseudodesulfovibrio sp.]